MQRHGWTLLFHDAFADQINRLDTAVRRLRKKNPEALEGNATYKLHAALSHLVLDVIPTNPNDDRFRQGNTMGPEFRHWRRAKIGRRFRLFFRFDSKSRIIIFAWVNDAQTLRSAGGKSDPYAVFEKMLTRGNPPDDWDGLMKKCRSIQAPFQE